MKNTTLTSLSGLSKEEFLGTKKVAGSLDLGSISPETLVTVAHYRAITGACAFGCKEFMLRHKLPYTDVDGQPVALLPIKAAELLIILKKEGAYGVQAFEKLLQY